MVSYLYLGECRKAHGIKGGFHFRLENVEDSALSEGVAVLLKPLSGTSQLPDEGKAFKIAEISFGHKVMAYLEGIEDRNDVEALLPFAIYIDRDELPELEEGEFYLADLVGLEAIEAETEKALGKVETFYENGPQVVLAIGRGQEGFEVPYVENFVKEINLKERKIWVVVPEVIE